MKELQSQFGRTKINVDIVGRDPITEEIVEAIELVKLKPSAFLKERSELTVSDFAQGAARGEKELGNPKNLELLKGLPDGFVRIINTNIGA